MKNIIVFDVDGVLLDCTHRLHYITGESKDWDSFFSEEEMDKDARIAGYCALLKDISMIFGWSELRTMVATARPKRTRRITQAMVDLYSDSRMLMREDGDYRPDRDVKKEMLDEIGKENILFWIDDSPAVCDMLRANGVDVLQVGGRKV